MARRLTPGAQVPSPFVVGHLGRCGEVHHHCLGGDHSDVLQLALPPAILGIQEAVKPRSATHIPVHSEKSIHVIAKKSFKFMDEHPS